MRRSTTFARRDARRLCRRQLPKMAAHAGRRLFVARNGPATQPGSVPNPEMVRLRLAAALVKQTRLSDISLESGGVLEQIGVKLFDLGEKMAGGAVGGRCTSAVAESIVRTADYESHPQSAYLQSDFFGGTTGRKKNSSNFRAADRHYRAIEDAAVGDSRPLLRAR